MKKIPMRSCVVTKERLPKNELIRIVKTPTGEVVIDPTGKTNGRGAYLKKDEQVFKMAQKKRNLDKILETSVQESIYEDLKKIL